MDDYNQNILIPSSTYRLQITPDFDLTRATELSGYLSRLGISHLYSSPYLRAAPGSTHGYDIVDYQEINPELGGREAHKNLCSSLEKQDLRQVLDIVPNHMCITAPGNRQWQGVLREGPLSPTAHFFDILWDSSRPGLKSRVLLPFLDRPLGQALQSGSIRLEMEEDEFHLVFCGQKTPVSPETEEYLESLADAENSREPGHTCSTLIGRINRDPVQLEKLIHLQYYLPAYWQEGNDKVNYRRFFHLTHLAGIRIEDRRVFDHVHRLPLEWHHRGWAEGFRVDHPDGFANPQQYFRRLREESPRAWVVAEKILTPGEHLPSNWPIHGTTGYDFLNTVSGLFIQRQNEQAFTNFYHDFTGRTASCDEVIRQSRLEVIRSHFVSETSRLTTLLAESLKTSPPAGDWNSSIIKETVEELTASFPVYRTYMVPSGGEINDRDRKYIRAALTDAARKRPDIGDKIWDFIRNILLLKDRGGPKEEFVIRFQQLTAAAMAKGFEDTALYRYNRLISLNEVGGDPGRFGVSTGEFHDFCIRLQRDRPATMLTTATHDTKRGEDVRLRINLLSEIPRRWMEAVRLLSAAGRPHRREGLIDRNTEYFLYQTLAGTWPIGTDRLIPYMIKAVREAKENTSWTDPDQEYEEGLCNFITSLLEKEKFRKVTGNFLPPVAEAARTASLSQTLIKYTAPGVPDLYQGTELWDMNLVDPDNRRPVDYRLRENLLREVKHLHTADIVSRMEEGLPKLFLIHRILKLRRDHPLLFAPSGEYTPLYARGSQSDHLVAFMRGNDIITLAPRLTLTLEKWGEDTTIDLPRGEWTSLFAGGTVSGETPVGALLRDFPVSLLVRKG